jgi:hypothetical protein
VSRRSDSTAHPYEPEPCPILHAWPEHWWMNEMERLALEEALARQYGGQGIRPRPERER